MFFTIASPERYDTHDKAIFGKIDVIGQKPLLQYISGDLTEIEMDVYVHYLLGTSVEESISVFRSMIGSGQPYPLVRGGVSQSVDFPETTGVPTSTAQQASGNFVLRELDIRHKWMGPTGKPLAAQLTLRLVQWIGQLPSTISQAPLAILGSPGGQLASASMLALGIARLVSLKTIAEGLPNTAKVAAETVVRFAKGII